MSVRVLTATLMALPLVLLGACGEKPQVTTAKKHDAQAFQGTGDGYAVAGWKAGDQTSWEQQMRIRAQGQNEYSRAAAQ